jgi:hypothetical protein
MVGLSVAIPAASLCINRRVYLITVQSRTSCYASTAEKRRAVWSDLAIGVGIPLLEMILRTYIPNVRYTQTHTSFILQNTLSKDIVSTSSRTLAAIL